MNIPEGWKLVPVEPTPAMVEAAFDALPNSPFEGRIRTHYRAMLAAAPTTPAPVSMPEPLSDAEIETVRKAAFSVSNPFCPIDRQTMRKAARAIEAEVLRRVKEANK